MTKEQKANRYTQRWDILTFIDGFRKHFVTMTFMSPKECKEFAWTDDAFEIKERPIVRMFTEGWCYYFARILEDAYPGGTICLYKRHGHIVYLYKNKFYDITGEITNPRAKFIPIAYFGDLINDFKQCYLGDSATRAEILRCVNHAKQDGNVLTVKNTAVKPISTDGTIYRMVSIAAEKIRTETKYV